MGFFYSVVEYAQRCAVDLTAFLIPQGAPDELRAPPRRIVWHRKIVEPFVQIAFPKVLEPRHPH
jgi:hypothetical protein